MPLIDLDSKVTDDVGIHIAKEDNLFQKLGGCKYNQEFLTKQNHWKLHVAIQSIHHNYMYSHCDDSLVYPDVCSWSIFPD